MIRRMLVLAVAAVLAVGLSNGTATRAADDCPKCDPRPGLSMTKGTICPIYPFAFYGSYWSYYALQGPNCNNPGAYNGPPSLPCGCPANCFKLKMGKRNSAPFKGDPFEGVSDYQTSPAFNLAGVRRLGNKEIYFLGINPATGENEVIKAKVFRVLTDPPKFDPNAVEPPLDKETFERLREMRSEILGVGHEIAETETLPDPDDSIVIKQDGDPVDSDRHIFYVPVTDDFGVTIICPVVIKTRS